MKLVELELFPKSSQTVRLTICSNTPLQRLPEYAHGMPCTNDDSGLFFFLVCDVDGLGRQLQVKP
jgi:hypothetical protein